MGKSRITIALCGALLLGACDEQVPDEFLRNRPGDDGPAVTLVDGGTIERPAVDADEVKPLGPCLGLDYFGACDGAVVRWCNREGRLDESDCAAEGLECGWIDDELGYYCGHGVAGRERPAVGMGEPPDVVDAEGCGRPLEMAVLELVNNARAGSGLHPYVCDDALTKTARLHSQDMCERRYFSHRSRDGRSHSQRMREQGADFRASGENIAYGQPTPESVHRTWMNSSGHRRNIMSRGFSRIGVGHHDCGGTMYWTQNFAD